MERHLALLRLAFMIRSVYDVFPSRTNLQKWGIVQDASCKLCRCHSLSARQCSRHARTPLPIGATQGDIIKACSQTNARETAPASRIYFLREGSSQHCKKKNENQRRDLLSKAKDWEVAADLQGERHCHKMLQESGKRT